MTNNGELWLFSNANNISNICSRGYLRESKIRCVSIFVVDFDALDRPAFPNRRWWRVISYYLITFVLSFSLDVTVNPHFLIVQFVVHISRRQVLDVIILIIAIFLPVTS